MTTLAVPANDETPWPTLGPQVCDWIVEHLVFGPGDLRGEPYVVEPEFRAQLYRAYEVFPRGHPRAGRRRFKRVALSMRKGTAKTEKAAIVAAAELHPDAPVRCDGFDADGLPVGRGVRDPYIPLVAYTEEQTEELAFGALYVILSESNVADDFDIGLERILVLDDRGRAAGKAVPLAGSPNARDGARTTFQHFDETHRFTLEGLRRAHRTMLANIPKRPMADPWSLETTTAFTPGEGSVAEATFEYAQAILKGDVKDPQLWFFHRQACDEHDLSGFEGRKAAVVEASGPQDFGNLDDIARQWDDPDNDPAYLERVWLNRPRQAAMQAFDVSRWRELARPDHHQPDGALVTLGFDGSRWEDATALIATDVVVGYQWVLGIWERPYRWESWEVPRGEVDAAFHAAFEMYDVWRAYCDPFKWGETVERWQGRYGEKRVVPWETGQGRYKAMAVALRKYRTAMTAGELTHDGNSRFEAHIGHAQRSDLNMRDEDDQPLWLIRKERSDSPNKIDAAMAGCLSWEARGDAIAAGATVRKAYRVLGY